MREYIEQIIKLADDTSYSHAARMIEIKRLAKQALDEIDTAGRKAGSLAEKPAQPPAAPAPQATSGTDGGKTGNPTKEPPKAPAGKVTI